MLSSENISLRSIDLSKKISSKVFPGVGQRGISMATNIKGALRGKGAKSLIIQYLSFLLFFHFLVSILESRITLA